MLEGYQYELKQGGIDVAKSNERVFENILVPFSSPSSVVIGGLLTSSDQTNIYNAQANINANSFDSVLFELISLAVGIFWYFKYLFHPIGQVVASMTAIVYLIGL
jgi:hypothetical protein